MSFLSNISLKLVIHTRSSQEMGKISKQRGMSKYGKSKETHKHVEIS
eukprot:UN07601